MGPKVKVPLTRQCPNRFEKLPYECLFKLLENKWLFERDGYLFPYEDWKDAGMEKFQTIKNLKSRTGIHEQHKIMIFLI